MKVSYLWIVAICTALLTITIEPAMAEERHEVKIGGSSSNKRHIILREGYPLRPQNMNDRQFKRRMMKKRRLAAGLSRRIDSVVIPSITLPTIETQQQQQQQPSPAVQPGYSAASAQQQHQSTPAEVQQTASPATASDPYSPPSSQQPTVGGTSQSQSYPPQQNQLQKPSSYPLYTYPEMQPEQQQQAPSPQNMLPVNYYGQQPPPQLQPAPQQQGITLPSISQASLPTQKKKEDDEEEEDEDEEDEEDYDADDLVTKRR